MTRGDGHVSGRNSPTTARITSSPLASSFGHSRRLDIFRRDCLALADSALLTRCRAKGGKPERCRRPPSRPARGIRRVFRRVREGRRQPLARRPADLMGRTRDWPAKGVLQGPLFRRHGRWRNRCNRSKRTKTREGGSWVELRMQTSCASQYSRFTDSETISASLSRVPRVRYSEPVRARDEQESQPPRAAHGFGVVNQWHPAR